MKNQAISLCRVSTKKQRLEGSSLEAQEVRVNECAAYLDAEIIKYWSLDTSSRKGKNIARADLHEMMDFCKKNKRVKYIIVDEADRFMRSVEEAFYWKVQFKLNGVFLALANMPEVTHEDDPMTVLRVFMAFFQGESSNHERITKAKDKMQAKIDQGYYPGVPHYGYQKSDTPSIHIPDEPKYSLLQESMQGLVSGKFSLGEALKWLQLSGLKLDMNKYKKILKEPYYCGTVKMGSFKTNENGLHQSMITKDEFEIVSRMAKGQKAKFSVNRYNPDFPCNGLLCNKCFFESENKSGKFTGYKHHNGKKGNSKKFYERYHCRSCGMAFKKDDLHESLERFLMPVQLAPEVKEELKVALRMAWSEIEQDSLKKVKRLEAKLKIAQEQKTRLIVSLAENPEYKEDTAEALEAKKTEIELIEEELDSAKNIEDDFNEFVDFSLDFVDNLKANWWSIDREDRERCEELIFPQRLRVLNNRKVSTPFISPIYRYKSAKKIPVGSLNSSNGGAYARLLAPIIDELQRWRPLLSTDYNRYRLRVKGRAEDSPLGVSP